ncbi:hypothetical protein CEXT_702381 [Caerostris extrusa]|uniref:Uncharacterized protein n=1 Tax=Caerostris extrusa TaxID=172846 RepID=A0AAV4N803_CAEEX|nr:hypothetical protein CEXT_702381 [Caerostris extrusa]
MNLMQVNEPPLTLPFKRRSKLLHSKVLPISRLPPPLGPTEESSLLDGSTFQTPSTLFPDPSFGCHTNAQFPLNRQFSLQQASAQTGTQCKSMTSIHSSFQITINTLHSKLRSQHCLPPQSLRVPFLDGSVFQPRLPPHRLFLTPFLVNSPNWL